MTQSPCIFWMVDVILRDLFIALFNKIIFMNLSREQQIIIIILHYLHSFNTYRSNQEAFNTLLKNKHRSKTYEIQPKVTQLKFRKTEFLIRKMLLNRFVFEIRISLFVLVSRSRTIQSELFSCFYFGTDFQRYFQALKDNIN